MRLLTVILLALVIAPSAQAGLVRIPLDFLDVPVYGNQEVEPRFSYYATEGQVIGELHGPLIVLNRQYLRPMMRASHGRYVKTWYAWNAWMILAHEYAHHLGHQHGASWGSGYERVTMRVLRELTGKAELPGKYEQWVLGRVRQYHRETS